jgi:tetratricopeptide (TPR) repeat protein
MSDPGLPDRRGWKRAGKLNNKGRAAADRGDLDAAERLYREAIEAEPQHPFPWFNLGLLAKHRGDWRMAADCNQRAAATGRAGRDDPAWWNLGIAATALGDWATARRAWSEYGVEILPGEGPVVMDFGMRPVRLSPHGGAEVVWGHRIDPARIVVESVPSPDSGHRWHDVVLHDGVPNGERELNGARVPVFDELVRLEPSDVPTVVADVWCASSGDSDALSAWFHREGWAGEDWERTVRYLCKACSEGSLEAHQHDPDDEWVRDRRFLLAAPLEQCRRSLTAWAEESLGNRRVGQVEVAF